MSTTGALRMVPSVEPWSGAPNGSTSPPATRAPAGAGRSTLPAAISPRSARRAFFIRASLRTVTPNPVLLVHGFASSFHLNWQESGLSYLLEDAGREVIGVDLLGHGDAPKPHDPADYADLGARVVDVLPPSGTVDAIGFSMGARTLIEVAAAHPERFGKLVFAGVGQNLFMDGDKESIARAIEFGDGGPGGIAALFVSFANGSGNDP